MGGCACYKRLQFYCFEEKRLLNNIGECVLPAATDHLLLVNPGKETRNLKRICTEDTCRCEHLLDAYYYQPIIVFIKLTV